MEVEKFLLASAGFFNGLQPRCIGRHADGVGQIIRVFVYGLVFIVTASKFVALFLN